MDFKDRLALRGHSSLPYWWEKTRRLDVPQPKTVYIPVPEKILMASLDGGALDAAPLLAAAEEVGGYPIFLRTDQLSGKHHWKDTCYVESADAMLKHMYALVDENYMADMAGEAAPSGFAVREFLDLDWQFRAFLGQMPIATEVRTFVRDGAVECIHPYWPPGAIDKWADPPQTDLDSLGISDADILEVMQDMPDMPDAPERAGIPEDWRSIMDSQNERASEDADTIRAQALKVAAVMDGWWSADMALGRDGLWYLIDMAPGAVSYHWPSCKHKPDDQPDFSGG